MYVILKHGDLGEGVNEYSAPIAFTDSTANFTDYVNKLAENNHAVKVTTTHEHEFGRGSLSIWLKDVDRNEPSYQMVCMPLDHISSITNEMKPKILK